MLSSAYSSNWGCFLLSDSKYILLQIVHPNQNNQNQWEVLEFHINFSVNNILKQFRDSN